MTTLTTKVELKATVRHDEVERAFDVLGLRNDQAQKKQRVVFFEDLDGYCASRQFFLKEHKLILRAREKTKKAEATVKVRPVEGALLEGLRAEGLDIEEDRVVGRDKQIVSASLDNENKKESFDEVLSNPAELYNFFSPHQREVIARFTGLGFDDVFRRLRATRPAPCDVWTLRLPDFPHELTVESWQLPDYPLLEISLRVENPLEASAREQDLVRFLIAKGLDPGGTGRTKTDLLLTHAAERHCS